MNDKTKLNENDLKTVTGGAGLSEQQWDALMDTVNKLSMGNALPDMEIKELITCIANRDLNALIPKISGRMGNSIAGDMLRNVLGSFVNLATNI